MTNSRNRFIVVVAVFAAVAAVAGLYFSGYIGGSKDAQAKVVMEPVRFTDPFVVNLADENAVHYVKLGVAVQLAPMSKSDRSHFLYQPKGEGADAMSGEQRLANYPPLRDAVIDTVSSYTSSDLLKPEGKKDLKLALRAAFAKVEQQDRARLGKHGSSDVAEPPFHVIDVYFSEFAVQ